MGRVRASRRRLQGGDLDLLKQLAAKFQGEFLEGFEADRIPLFEAWLIGERQKLQTFQADVLSRIIALLPRTGEALPYIRKRLGLLPYDVGGASGSHGHACGLWALRRSRGPSGGGDPSVQESGTEFSRARPGFAGTRTTRGPGNPAGIVALSVAPPAR